MEVMTIGTIYIALVLMNRLIRFAEIVFWAAVVLLVLVLWPHQHNKEEK